MSEALTALLIVFMGAVFGFVLGGYAGEGAIVDHCNSFGKFKSGGKVYICEVQK
jgi:hypothetical protein